MEQTNYTARAPKRQRTQEKQEQGPVKTQNPEGLESTDSTRTSQQSSTQDNLPGNQRTDQADNFTEEQIQAFNEGLQNISCNTALIELTTNILKLGDINWSEEYLEASIGYSREEGGVEEDRGLGLNIPENGVTEKPTNSDAVKSLKKIHDLVERDLPTIESSIHTYQSLKEDLSFKDRRDTIEKLNDIAQEVLEMEASTEASQHSATAQAALETIDQNNKNLLKLLLFHDNLDHSSSSSIDAEMYNEL